MHWLCFSPSSPQVLEEAGFAYDSTVGYNDVVGYRSGTTQVYRPPGATILLELPLHIQDTALFYEGYMGLTSFAAEDRCNILVNNVERYGGVLTILWRPRSLAPERLWNDSYVGLLKTLQKRRVWFATADQVVDWFRKRRAYSFENAECPEALHDGTPPLLLKIHAPNEPISEVLAA